MILVLPLSVVRWIGFSKGNSGAQVVIPSVATLVVINIYSLSGALNALLLLWTRSSLIFYRKPSIEAIPISVWDNGIQSHVLQPGDQDASGLHDIA